MIFLLRMAFRNIMRHRLRSLLSGLVVVSGVAVLIIGKGFIGGLRENIIRASVDTMSGHVSIRPVDYPDAGFEHPLDVLYSLRPEIIQAVEAESVGWTPRTYAMADAIAYPNSLRVRLIGFDLERDPSVYPRSGWKMNPPDALETLDADGGVLVSSGVAKLFDLKPGDMLTLQARTAAGSINALAVPVQAIFSMGNPAIDSFGVLAPTAVFNELIDTENVSHVSIRLSHRDDAEAVAETLRVRLGAMPLSPGDDFESGTEKTPEYLGDIVEVTTWFDATKELLELQKIREKSLNFLVFVLLGIAGLGIANTILMAAFERMREIGTLRAMGMRRRKVLIMFLLEGGLIGMIGGLIGAILGAALIYNYSVNPIDMTPMIEGKGAANFPISTLLYTEFSTQMIAWSFAFGVIISVLSSIYPSVIATRMAPADAVRAE